MSELMTFAGTLARARTTNATDTSFAAKIPTVTEPTGAGIIDLATGQVMHNNLFLIPFGTDADNETFDMRIIGWRKASLSGSADIWLPIPLLQVSCTLSDDMLGVAAAALLNTEFLADTITAAVAFTEYAGISYQLSSPANDTPAHILLDCKGCKKIEVLFDLTGAAGANAFYGTF